MDTKIEATLDDLYRVPEHSKAELVNGELVLMSPTGCPAMLPQKFLSACAPMPDKRNQAMLSRIMSALW